MRDYAVVANIKAEQKGIIDDVFDKGYEQGYQDGKAELPTMSTGYIADIKKAEYDRGFDEGYARAKLITTNDAYEAGYDKGYEKGKQESIEACKKCEHTWQDGYSEGYEKGLKHGQELRAKEAECAEACGMKRAWDVARKIVDFCSELTQEELGEIFGSFDVNDILNGLSAFEAVEKIEAWEKKQEQEQSKKRCENCDHYCGYDNKFKCDIKGVLCIERDRWTPKQKQVEKSCKTCSHTETGMPKNDNAQCEECHFDGSGNTLWQPKEKQDAPEMNVESIEVGDEVYQLDKNYTYIVTNTDDKIACFFSRTGHWGCRSISELHKTGRHFPIQEILDAMKNNSEENNDNDG